MNLRNAAGAVSRFAHLSGLSRPAAKAAEEDKPEDRKEEDEKDEAAKAAEDDEEDKDAKAADEDKDPNDDDDRKDADGEPEPKDKDGKAAYAAGFKAAQARAAAILGHAAAAGNPALAAELACGTDIPTAQAVALLSVGSAPAARSGLASRMATTPAIRIGADQPSDPPASKDAEASQQASRILAAARTAGAKF